jgi:hypothetical protein
MTDVRPIEDGDRQRAAAVLGGAAVLATGDTHVIVGPGGADDGIAVWREPAPGEEPELGPVIVPAAAGPRRLYELALACAQDARARGYRRAHVRVLDERLLAQLERDFTIDARPRGWEPNTGRAVEWEIEVDLDDAVGQLERVL